MAWHTRGGTGLANVLHKRGYRPIQTRAPLNEALADLRSAVIRLSTQVKAAGIKLD